MILEHSFSVKPERKNYDREKYNKRPREPSRQYQTPDGPLEPGGLRHDV
nr:MAG TPA: hypothetical protein [Caudoviricetes sp.]